MSGLPADLDQYEWADSGDVMAVCVCAVTAVQPHDALAAVGASNDSAAMTFAEAQSTWAVDATPVQVDAIGSTVVLIEPNGWRCSDERVVARLSTAGRAASVYWNVNALMRFVYADHGTVLRDFDPLLYDATGALAEEADLPFGQVMRARAAALALLERLMGVRIHLEWLIGRRRTTWWVNPDQDRQTAGARIS